MIRGRRDWIFKIWIICVCLSALSLSGCSAQTEDGGTKTRDVAVSSPERTEITSAEMDSSSSFAPSSEEGTPSEEEVTATTHSALPETPGRSVGETNPHFSAYLQGRVGKRPESGAVVDAQDVTGNYPKISELSRAWGIEKFYIVPQIVVDSEAGKLLNQRFSDRAAEDLDLFEREIGIVDVENKNALSGWIYADYAVYESERFISIVTVRSKTFGKTFPDLAFEAYVYDKSLQRVVRPSELIMHFYPDEDRDVFLSGLEDFFIRHSADFQEYEPAFYNFEYRDYLKYLWNVVFVRGKQRLAPDSLIPEEAGRVGLPPRRPIGFFTDDASKPHVIIMSAKFGGYNEMTGNAVLERGFAVSPLEALRGERSVSNLFRAANVGDSAAADRALLGVIYVGDSADEQAVRTFLNFKSASAGEGMSAVRLSSRSENPSFYILVPKYPSSLMEFRLAGNRRTAESTGATLLFERVDAENALEVVLRSRGDEVRVFLTGNPSDGIEDGRVIDLTPSVRTGDGVFSEEEQNGAADMIRRFLGR